VSADAEFRVLFVCTGNICRSPMAQSMLTAALRERFGADADRVEVRSAGTYAVVGEDIEPDAKRFLDTVGVKPDPFEARQLLEQHVAAADLVLGATRAHRAAAVTLVPAAAKRTFTIRELARLVEDVDLEEDGDVVRRFQALVPAAAQRRGLVRPDHPDDDDVADPYRMKYGAFEAAGRQLHAAIATIVDRVDVRT
jgi:protein-tyrosine phosphatase